MNFYSYVKESYSVSHFHLKLKIGRVAYRTEVPPFSNLSKKKERLRLGPSPQRNFNKL